MTDNSYSNSGDLPESFDFIICGTGLPESILAAAFARIGYSVLHIDRNEHYGGSYASFNLQSFQRYLDGSNDILNIPNTDDVTIDSENEERIPCPSGSPVLSDVNTSFNVSESSQQTSQTSFSSVIPPVPENQPIVQLESEVNHNVINGPIAADVDVPEEVNQEDQSENETSQLNNAVDESQTTSETTTSDSVPTTSDTWTVNSIQREWRRFNIDLSPKILYCRGQLVDLLISSDVGKYCEFRPVDKVLTIRDGTLEAVPCSRADVFSSNVSVIEKRMLMRFMQFCLDFDTESPRLSELEGQTFEEFLHGHNLSPHICHYIYHAITMATSTTSAASGMKKIQKFLRSLGRYGNTAFLWPLYGSGEIPQCFARLCAVFGGVYYLRIQPTFIVKDLTDNRCKAVVLSNGQRIQCRWLIAEYSYLPSLYVSIPCSRMRVSRAVLMCDKALLDTANNSIQFLWLPCEDDNPIRVLQLSAGAMVCPRNMYLVHLTRRHLIDPQTDLSPAVTDLFGFESDNTDKPRILWSTYFTADDSSSVHLSNDAPSNIYCIPGSSLELDADDCVVTAKRIFEEICPEDEFLPRPPAPEDIVYDVGGAGAAEGPMNVEMVNGQPGDAGDTQQ